MLLTHKDKGIWTIFFNRPEVKNALNGSMMEALLEILISFGEEEEARILVLRGAGESFCSGADVTWMKEMAVAPMAENERMAKVLGMLLQILDETPKPTLGLVDGPAYGGALGLLGALDIVIATRRARFALSEVRLGLLPALISPYVLRAMGERSARRYMLTGEAFGAEEARSMGVVHEINDDLEGALVTFRDLLFQGGKQAQGNIKKLLRSLRSSPSDFLDQTVYALSRARAGEEGREGVAAFLEKRKPQW